MLLVTLASLLACSNAFFFPSQKTVAKLEVPRYLGRWNEAYSSFIQRATFQKNSYCTTATYSLKDKKTINVFNAGRKNSETGPAFSANGTAKVAGPGKLIVNFPTGYRQATTPNYLVLKLGSPNYGPNGLYQYTIIGSPYKLLCWILVRDIKTFKEKYELEALQFLRQHGYSYIWNKPRLTVQNDKCLYPSM